MLPRWSFRYGAYDQEEDWDLNSLSVVNSQLKMYIGRLPGGPGDLTLAELQEMATRQQQQMESQQQVLVAKEQRLKYLKQQEARHAQLASESERLRKIRERVESQELKLKKLRALRGQAEQYRINNGQLNSELDAVRAVFNEKEKELAMAVARVDQLTRQLSDLRNGKANIGISGQKQAAAALELEKLRKELLLRNKLNEQQTNNINAKEKLLQQKKEEVKNMDNRIQELQQRLKKRKQLENQSKQTQRSVNPNNQNTQNNTDNLNNTKQRNFSVNSMKAGEPYIQYAPSDVIKDDSYSQQGPFIKRDPKYQTLPPGVRFNQPIVDGRIPHPNSTQQFVSNSELRDPHSDYNLPVVLPIGNDNSSQKRTSEIQQTSQKQPKQQQQYQQHPQRLPYQPHPDSVHPATINKPQTFNNNDFNKPNQNVAQVPTSQSIAASQPHPVPAQWQPQKPSVLVDHSNVNRPNVSTNRFAPLPIPPKPSSLSSSSSSPIVGPRDLGSQGKGEGDGIAKPSVYPIINIQEEERQAGSGQSSPASSEGSSNSSGGIQIKNDELHTNEASIGPVSAMIERLNKGNNIPQSKSIPRSSEQTPVQNSSQNWYSKPAGEGVTTFLATNKQKSPNDSGPSTNQGQTGLLNSDGTRLKLGSDSPSFSQVSNNNNNLNASSIPPPSSPSSQHPQLNLKPAPTYRYASKNQIANTYMGRLGGAAMDKYQHNLNKLYKNLEVQEQKDGSKDVTGHAQKSESVVSGQEGEGQTAFGAVSPHDYPDIASDKGSYKLNTPKQVRRRHSDGESEEVNKALQDHQEQGAKEQKLKEETVKLIVDQGQPIDVKTPSADSEKQLKTNVDPNKTSIKEQAPQPSVSIGPVSLSSSSSSVTIATSSSSSSPTVVKSETKSSQVQQDPDSAKLSKVESIVKKTKSNLKKGNKRRSTNRVSFDPLALLLDGSLEGELDLVKKVAVQVDDVSTPNDEGITALHNAICAGHYDIVKFLIEFGCDVNSPDSDGWTPLHCAASCNNLPMVRFLVEHGACVFATTISDQETAADKCEEDEDGYDGCSDYLYSIQEKLGITKNGEVYAVFDYISNAADELSFSINDKISVLRKGDEKEKEWWWAQLNGTEGYIPRNLLGLFPRVIQQPSEVSEC